MPSPFRDPLAWINRLVPKDRGTRRIASGLTFGPDPRHRLDLFAPDKPRAALPVMLFIYGGGWSSGSRIPYAFAGRAFAALGFLTAIADYRLVPDVRFPAFVEDGGLALSWLQKHAATYGGDPNRLFVAGHSAGAYNAIMLALQPERFGAPPVQGAVGLSGPFDFYPFDVKESQEAFRGDPRPQQTQPANLVTSAAPPMFLGHGDRDRTVLPRNTVTLAGKLRAAGVRVVEKHYPLDHVGPLLHLLRPLRWRSSLYRDMAAFLAASSGVGSIRN